MDWSAEALESHRAFSRVLSDAYSISTKLHPELLCLLQDAQFEAEFSELVQRKELTETESEAEDWTKSKTELGKLIKTMSAFQTALKALDNPGVRRRLKVSAERQTELELLSSPHPTNARAELLRIAAQLEALQPIISGAESIHGNEVRNAVSQNELAQGVIQICRTFWVDTINREAKIDKSRLQAAGGKKEGLTDYLRFIHSVLDYCGVNIAPHTLATLAAGGVRD